MNDVRLSMLICTIHVHIYSILFMINQIVSNVQSRRVFQPCFSHSHGNVYYDAEAFRFWDFWFAKGAIHRTTIASGEACQTLNACDQAK